MVVAPPPAATPTRRLLVADAGSRHSDRRCSPARAVDRYLAPRGPAPPTRPLRRSGERHRVAGTSSMPAMAKLLRWPCTGIAWRDVGRIVAAFAWMPLGARGTGERSDAGQRSWLATLARMTWQVSPQMRYWTTCREAIHGAVLGAERITRERAHTRRTRAAAIACKVSSSRHGSPMSTSSTRRSADEGVEKPHHRVGDLRGCGDEAKALLLADAPSRNFVVAAWRISGSRAGPDASLRRRLAHVADRLDTHVRSADLRVRVFDDLVGAVMVGDRPLIVATRLPRDQSPLLSPLACGLAGAAAMCCKTTRLVAAIRGDELRDIGGPERAGTSPAERVNSCTVPHGANRLSDVVMWMDYRLFKVSWPRIRARRPRH